MRYKARPRRPTKLDPYKDYIAARLAAAAPDAIQSNVLLEEIRARGYEGGERVVKVHVAKLRAASAILDPGAAPTPSPPATRNYGGS